MSSSAEDIAEAIREELPGTEEIIVQYLSGYLLDLDDAAEDEDVLQVTRTILESATPSSSRSSQDVQLDKLLNKLGKMLEKPLNRRAEKNRAGKANGLVRLDKVVDLSKGAMSNTIAFGEGVDLESINKGK
jgi:ATP-binding cassette, subfamily F, member 3